MYGVICLLTGEYVPQPGGVGDYTRCLGLALRARGHAIAVITIQEGALVCYGGEDLATVQWVSGAGLDWSHRAWPAVIGALDRLRPSWLHIQYQTGAYAMRPGVNLLPWRLRALSGRPRAAVTFHDLLVPYLFPKAGPARTWVHLRLARDVDAVVVTTTADSKRLRALANLAPRVIPIGSNIAVAPPHDYDRTTWRTGLAVTSGELLVAYFGLLSFSKGADLLAEALAGLERPWRLLLVGGAATTPQDVAYAEAVRARLEALGLTGRVIATGHVSDRNVSAHLLAADCVALPFRDGASFRRGSLLAALAHGVPVVTTAPGDAETARQLAGAALAVAPEPVALSRAIAYLADHPVERAQLGVAGQALAARFSWEAIARQHEALYGA